MWVNDVPFGLTARRCLQYLGFAKCLLIKGVFSNSHSGHAESSTHVFLPSFAESLKGTGAPGVLTQGFADVTDSLKHHGREADSQPHRLHVRQSKAQHFVLRGEEKLGICLNPTFVQGPVGFQKPAMFLFPPKSKV